MMTARTPVRPFPLTRSAWRTPGTRWGVLALVGVIVGVALVAPLLLAATAQAAQVTAKVVAMDQVLTYNRLGAFNPAGMIFALARDVFPKGTPAANQTLAFSCASPTVTCSPGNVQLRDDKRPRPLTLRVNEGDIIKITLINLLSPLAITDAKNEAPGIDLCETVVPPGGTPRPGICQSEQPFTRKVSIHVNGLRPLTVGDDGSKVGNNASSLVAPGDQRTYTLRADKEGAYVITSGPNFGGQGGNGAIASGLFGVLNVEPANSTWYRSQLTRVEMVMAADLDGDGVLETDPAGDGSIPSELTPGGHPKLDYNAVYPAGHPYAGKPILKILDGTEIFHSDLNAIIAGPGPEGTFPGEPSATQLYPNRGKAFREFTVAFHDEFKVVQAFPGWFNTLPFTLGSVKDGFGINYGSGGIGSEIIANRLGQGPMHECVECKYEEFFLTSWVVGDPAMIVDVPANAGLEAHLPGDAPLPPEQKGPKATRAFYPDDPSNVWHGYLNDRTKIRNIHVGTEHHIFHLHAHQWLYSALDDAGVAPGSGGSNYLDAQAIGPGSSFTYEITYGGGGNRNKTAGDSIFHCHFYPHFAQGMWGLWRVHDTFEVGSLLNPDGTVAERGLLDAEICTTPAGGVKSCGGYDSAGDPLPGGSPTPAVVALPGMGMAPMPGAFVASVDDDDDPGTPNVSVPFMGFPFYIAGTIGHRPPSPPLDIVPGKTGGIPRHVIYGGTSLDHNGPIDFNREILTAKGYQLPETGTAEEKAAMAFHGPQPGTGVYHSSYKPGWPSPTPGSTPGSFEVNGLPPVSGAPFAEPCRSDVYDGGGPGNLIGTPRYYAASVIEIDAKLNKVGWHFGQQRVLVLDGDVAATRAGTRAPEPFVMRANTRDCVDFDHTNLVPNVYQLDDFQVKTPTDIIGQHIHLVKFDVMSADGAANGWNYEDGTMSPDELAERIHALTAVGGSWMGGPLGPAGPRTTRQRWYVDPGWSGNVFTHDHYGPSTHQQVGLYATLLVEPEGSIWKDPVTGDEFGTRLADGGPTSWRADIDCVSCTDPALKGDAWREFYLEFADYQLAYRSADGDGAGFFNGPNRPINPSDRNEVGLPHVLLPKCTSTPGLDAGPNGCRPEAISAADPGTFVVNMRNEPLALRLRNPGNNEQAAGKAGDLSYAFSSAVNRADSRLNAAPSAWHYNDPTVQTANQGALTGDPFTPLMRVYEGDKVYLRVQVGAHEEGHNFSLNGVRWLQQWASPYSGFRNSQVAGISEYFIFRTPAMADVKGGLPFEDYKYEVGSSVDARWNGAWGLMRAYTGLQPDLQPLPTNPNGKVPPNPERREFQGVCPRTAPTRNYSVLAVRAVDVLPGGAIPYHQDLKDANGLLYVLKDDIDKRTGKLHTGRRVEPLILRANAGDCINVTLTNQFGGAPLDANGFNTLPMIVNEFNGNSIVPSIEVGLHAQLVEYDMSKSDGMNVGFNPVQTVAPGGIAKYTWYAGKIDFDITTGDRTAVPVEFGAVNLMASDPIEGSSKGLIGALIIEPKDSTWNPNGELGTDLKLTRAAVTVTKASGESFRDFVVIHQDDVNMQFANARFGFAVGDPVPTVAAEEEPEDSGQKGINYRTEPIWLRLNVGPTAKPGITRLVDYENAFAGTPATPIYTAPSGGQIRLRILKPGGHNRNHTPTLHGFVWAQNPYNWGSTEIDPNNPYTFWHGEQMGHGASNHVDVVPLAGCPAAGDFLYRDMTPVHVDNGQWAIVRCQ